MADYFSSFSISATGMSVEKLRLDMVALNLANANTSAPTEAGRYRAKQVVSTAITQQDFNQVMQSYHALMPQGVQQNQIIEENTAPRLVHNPNHPHANKDGYVALPNIDPVEQMMTLIEATRSYEANVKAMNAAKLMAQSALKIGN